MVKVVSFAEGDSRKRRRAGADRLLGLGLEREDGGWGIGRWIDLHRACLAAVNRSSVAAPFGGIGQFSHTSS